MPSCDTALASPSTRYAGVVEVRRWIVLALILGVILAFAGPAAADRPGKVELVSERAAALVVGDTAWLSFTWRADGDLSDFRAVVRRSTDAEVTYPENTGTYTAPYQSQDLMDGEIDFTAIRVYVPESADVLRNKAIKLQLEASWDTGGRRRTSIHNIKIPLALYEGEDVAQVTELVEVPAGGGSWIEVAYSGLAPLVERFSVVVGPDPALPVTYPGYGSDTSLHHDAALEDGETDVVRFFVDAAGLEPGSYTLSLLASYTRGDEPSGVKGIVTVAVVP